MTNPKNLLGKDVTVISRHGWGLAEYTIRFAILERVGVKYYHIRPVLYRDMEREVLRWTDREPIPMTQVIEGHDHALCDTWLRWKQELSTCQKARWREQTAYKQSLQIQLDDDLGAHMAQWDAEHPAPPAPPELQGIFNSK